MMEKRCRNCGTIVRAEAVYCPECGKRDLVLYDPDAPEEISPDNSSSYTGERDKNAHSQKSQEVKTEYREKDGLDRDREDKRAIKIRPDLQGYRGNETQELRTISLKQAERTDSRQNGQDMRTVYHQPDTQTDRIQRKQTKQEELNWPEEENAAEINLQYDEKISHMKRARKTLAIALLAVTIVLILYCSIVYGKSILIKFGIYSLKGGTVRIYSYYTSDTGSYRVDIEGDELVIYYDNGYSTVCNYEFVSDRFLLLKYGAEIYMCNYNSKLYSGKLTFLDIKGAINLEYLGNWSLVYIDDDSELITTSTIELCENGSMLYSYSTLEFSDYYYCWRFDDTGQLQLLAMEPVWLGYTQRTRSIIQIDEDNRTIYYQN